MSKSYVSLKDLRITYTRYKTYICFLLIFFCTMVLNLPQIIQGTVVNFIILSNQSKSRATKILVCVIPSVFTVIHNTIFGINTKFLLLFLPIIWISNYLYIISYNTKQTRLFSSIIKATSIFIYAYVLYSYKLIPSPLLVNMGLLQLITSSLGILFYSLSKSNNQKLSGQS